MARLVGLLLVLAVCGAEHTRTTEPNGVVPDDKKHAPIVYVPSLAGTSLEGKPISPCWTRHCAHTHSRRLLRPSVLRLP